MSVFLSAIEDSLCCWSFGCCRGSCW